MDQAGNLRCIPPYLNTARPVVWVNAHVDTVGASRDDFGGRDPFTCQETATHLIGRGANDCKAGVALMLSIADGIGSGDMPAFNGGFLITLREEAGSSLPRTAPQFAADMASGELPISDVPRGTFVWSLENTVTLAAHRKAETPEIAVYDRERHSFSLLCRGPLHALGRALLSLDAHEDWKTVAAWPLSDPISEPLSKSLPEALPEPAASAERRWPRRLEPEEALPQLGLRMGDPGVLSVLTQEGGHSCTVANVDNCIYRCLVREALRECGAMAGSHSESLPPAALTAWVATRAAEVDQGDDKVSRGNGGDGGDAGDGGEGGGVVMLWSGIESQPTRVATSVTTLPFRSIQSRANASAGEQRDAQHALILNYRGLKPVGEVLRQIDSLKESLGSDCVRWSDGASLESGEGSQQSEFIGGSLLPAAIESAASRLNVTIKFEPNPGRSDASHIWRSLPEELRGERVVPFTCGPGCRSHRCETEGVMRKTHGPNEGFHKATGAAVLPFFVELLRHFEVG